MSQPFASSLQETSAHHNMMNDQWARRIGIPVLSLAFAFIFHPQVMLRFNTESLLVLVPPTMFVLLLWEGNRLIFIAMRNKYPTHQFVGQRLVLQTVYSVIFTFLTTTVLVYVFKRTMPLAYCQDIELVHELSICMGTTLFITSIYESAYFFWQWKSNIQKTEALARENIQSQFEALKHQVDPHFLFNSLNTLAALIDEENQPAQKYLEQLSDVYRYVLLNKDRSTVTLEEELAFVESYIYLNKTRFRDNLQIETFVPPVPQRRLIAPLSLQMLVENAIKHNVVSREKPLTIRIYQEEDWIRVENNVQEKTVVEKSTKVGLQNIINRYSYLTANPVEIRSDTASFSVKLPLLVT
jgi:two-component system, LytTR family, sensor kinase